MEEEVEYGTPEWFLTEDPKSLEDAAYQLKVLRRALSIVAIAYEVPVDKIRMAIKIVKGLK